MKNDSVRLYNTSDVIRVAMNVIENAITEKPAFDHGSLMICDHCGRYARDKDKIEHEDYCLVKSAKRLLENDF